MRKKCERYVISFEWLGFSERPSFFVKLRLILNMPSRSGLRRFLIEKIYRPDSEYLQPDRATCGAIVFFSVWKKPEYIVEK